MQQRYLPERAAMNRVNPVSNAMQHDKILAHLESRHARYVILYRLGVESGLRVSDLLGLRASHIRECQRVGSHTLTMIKTKTEITIQLSPELLADIMAYIKAFKLRDNDALFWSRPRDRRRPLTRQHVHRVMRAAGVATGLDRIGTHSMRRTFALQLYRQCGDMLEVQKAMGHKYISSTMCYMLDADRRLLL